VIKSRQPWLPIPILRPAPCGSGRRYTAIETSNYRSARNTAMRSTQFQHEQDTLLERMAAEPCPPTRWPEGCYGSGLPWLTFVGPSPGGGDGTEPESARFTTIKTDQAPSTYCKERSLTIEMESLRTMGREWAGPRIRTPHTGLRTEERFRRWRSRLI
jgi:hypothetical protein